MKSKSFFLQAIYSQIFARWITCLIACFGMPLTVSAQPVAPNYNPIVPAKPTASDHLQAMISYFGGYCRPDGSKVPYAMKMEQNKITITFNENAAPLMNIIGGTLPADTPSMLFLDIGRLPAGDYTLTTIGSPCPLARTTLPPYVSDFKDYAFTVTDAMPQKPIPWIVQNLSGHWWDPANAGHGLFLHQDGKDNLLGTWFTYDATGRDAWYVFQPKWRPPVDVQMTEEAPLWQASKPVIAPGMLGNTALKTVGTIKLETARILATAIASGSKVNPQQLVVTVKFSDGKTQELNLVRFNP
jgi:hypothetical protein